MFSRIVPGALVRWFARPYVAGGSIEAGLATAARLRDEADLSTTLDLLGEDVRTDAQVAANIAAYNRLVDALHRQPLTRGLAPRRCSPKRSPE